MNNNQTTIQLGDILLLPQTREVYRAGKKINLSKRQYELFEFLARNHGRVVNRVTILEYIWHYKSEVITKTLDVHMAQIRRKIDYGYSKKLIKTLYGLGYKLCTTSD